MASYSLDASRLQKPKLEEVQRATSMLEFDEFYTCHVLGFSSVDDLYRRMSCAKQLFQIKKLLMLIVNAEDDPLIAKKCHEIPEKYTG